MSNILVLKRNGLTESYDPQKVSRVLEAAGLEPEKITKLLNHLSTWLESKTSPISSLDIRDQLIIQLETLDPYVAGLFKWYQKTKDASINV